MRAKEREKLRVERAFLCLSSFEASSGVQGDGESGKLVSEEVCVSICCKHTMMVGTRLSVTSKRQLGES